MLEKVKREEMKIDENQLPPKGSTISGHSNMFSRYPNSTISSPSTSHQKQELSFPCPFVRGKVARKPSKGSPKQSQVYPLRWLAVIPLLHLRLCPFNTRINAQGSHMHCPHLQCGIPSSLALTPEEHTAHKCQQDFTISSNRTCICHGCQCRLPAGAY